MGTMPLRHIAGERCASQRYRKHAMVSSVGPYKFSSAEFGAAACHSSAERCVSGSPQKRLQRKLGRLFGKSVPRRPICAGTDGTENHTVISLCVMYFVGDSSSTGVMP